MDVLDVAKEMLHRKYGDRPKQKIAVRFNEEVECAVRFHVEEKFALAYEASQEYLRKKQPFFAAGTGGASLLSYLLGISKVNPLPPHYYCPECKTVVWNRRKHDRGPSSCVCDCGAQMSCDGYNIAKEYFWNKVHRMNGIEIRPVDRVPEGMHAWCEKSFSERLDLWAFYYNSIANRGETYQPAECVEQRMANPFFFSYQDDIVEHLMRRKVSFQEAYAISESIRSGSAGRHDMSDLICAGVFSQAQVLELKKTKYLYPRVHAIGALLAIEEQRAAQMKNK